MEYKYGKSFTTSGPDLLSVEFEHENEKKNPHYINNEIINLHGTIGRKKDLIEKEVTGEGSKGDLCIKKIEQIYSFSFVSLYGNINCL